MLEQQVTKIINFFKSRRIEFNYKKEGLVQIFPILFIKNDNETATLWGFGKYNIAFVKGRNIVPINPLVEGEVTSSGADGINSEDRGLFSDYKKNPNGLTNKQKATLMFIFMGVAVVGAIVLVQTFKKRK